MSDWQFWMSQVVSLLAVAAGVLVYGEKDENSESLRHDKYQLAAEIACICFITAWAILGLVPMRLYFGARRRITGVLEKVVACSVAVLLASGVVSTGVGLALYPAHVSGGMWVAEAVAPVAAALVVGLWIWCAWFN